MYGDCPYTDLESRAVKQLLALAASEANSTKGGNVLRFHTESGSGGVANSADVFL